MWGFGGKIFKNRHERFDFLNFFVVLKWPLERGLVEWSFKIGVATEHGLSQPTQTVKIFVTMCAKRSLKKEDEEIR
jgi:hypothetical protein